MSTAFYLKLEYFLLTWVFDYVMLISGGGIMIKYKIDIFAELKRKGYNQTRIQRENLLPAQTAQNIKAGKSITLETLNKICIMLKMQPGDILEVVPTDEEKIKYY